MCEMVWKLLQKLCYFKKRVWPTKSSSNIDNIHNTTIYEDNVFVNNVYNNKVYGGNVNNLYNNVHIYGNIDYSYNFL